MTNYEHTAAQGSEAQRDREAVRLTVPIVIDFVGIMVAENDDWRASIAACLMDEIAEICAGLRESDVLWGNGSKQPIRLHVVR